MSNVTASFVPDCISCIKFLLQPPFHLIVLVQHFPQRPILSASNFHKKWYWHTKKSPEKKRNIVWIQKLHTSWISNSSDSFRIDGRFDAISQTIGYWENIVWQNIVQLCLCLQHYNFKVNFETRLKRLYTCHSTNISATQITMLQWIFPNCAINMPEICFSWLID